MNRKNLIYSLLLSLMTLLLFSCREDVPELIQTPAINVTTSTLVPNTDESGTTRAYIGTNVTAVGFNLDKVSHVRIDSLEAKIVEQSISKIVFEVPELPYAQQDNPHRVTINVFDADGETVIFNYNYFITVPVTDALVTSYTPETGTTGTCVELIGRNLDQLTKINVGGLEILDINFVSQLPEKVSFNVPAISTELADTELDILVYWGTNQIDVTKDTKFKYQLPIAGVYSEVLKIGDECTLSGNNLNLVEDLYWDTNKMIIVEKKATTITFQVPSSIEKTDPVIAEKPLTCHYGPSLTEKQLLSSLKIDTTPSGPATPEFSSIKPVDTDYTAIYLNKEVVVAGQNMASIEGFKIDGISVELSATPDDVSAKFVIPSTIKGTAKKSVSLVALYNGGNEADFGIIELYPFYYTKGLKIGVGSNSSSTYTTDGRTYSFLILDSSKVVSVEYWWKNSLDSYVKASTPLVASANKLAASAKAENYYSVKPYVFLTASSANNLAFQNPANSSSQLKTHRYPDNTSLPSCYGTPLVFYSVITEESLKTSVSTGTVNDILKDQILASASAPAFAKEETTSTWVAGSVLNIQYVTFEHASQTGGKPTQASHIRQQGYMYIKSVSCGDSETGLATSPRSGYVEFDLYWSNVIE